VPEVRTSLGTLPDVKDLPVRVEMPDVMTLGDGDKVTTTGHWRQRREEMKRILEYHAVGRMPPPPRNVSGREVASEAVLDGKVKYRLVRLTFGPERRVELSIGVFTPAQRDAGLRGQAPPRNEGGSGLRSVPSLSRPRIGGGILIFSRLCEIPSFSAPITPAST
jgi:hypothetical protein